MRGKESTRGQWAVVTTLVTLALAASACRSSRDSGPPQPSPAVERQASALTALARTGWVLSTCTSSTVCGGILANATDGSAATAWTTAANQTASPTAQLFKVDLLTAQTFVGIGLDAGSNTNNYPRNYKVEISSDNTTFTQVATGTGATPLVNVQLGPQTARYIRITLTGSASAPWSIAEFNVYGKAVARTGWAVSSSPTGTGASNAVDSSATTRWSSGAAQANGQFFQVDMGALKTINQITLDAGTSTGEFPHGLQVMVSKDGTTSSFTNLAAQATGSSQLVTIAFPSVAARYFRVLLTGGGANNWSIYDLNVFGSSTTPTALARPSWGTGSGTTSTPTGSGARTLPFDGSTTTKWTTNAAQASNNSFTLDMLAPQSFSQLTLDAGNTTDYPRSYKVEVSSNGSTFTQVATGTGSAQVVTSTFPLQTARYVRVTLTAGNSAFWAIAEFNVFGVALQRNGWVATSSITTVNGTNYQSNAIDGTASTRWLSGVTQAANQWFQLDMGAAETFTGLTLDAGTSTGLYPRGYRVDVSNDGTFPAGMTALATGTGTTELLSIPLPIQTARYVRVTLTGTGQTTQWAIHELNVWRGCGSGTCVASDQCHVAGVCDPVLIVCSNPPITDNTPCADGKSCTTGDKCLAGVCVGTVTCPATDQCHVAGTCDGAGACTNPAIADNTPCVDGKSCTANDRCTAGVCAGTVTCPATDQCHVAGTCDGAGACTNPAIADNTPCVDGKSCTTNDKCTTGVCGGTVTCPATDQCHVAGTCDGAGACTNPAIADTTPCVDGKSCTTNDKCTAGVCGGTVTCPATDQCHVAGTCDGAGACTNPAIADNTPCVDGKSCTTNDKCTAGVCGGTVTCPATDQCHVAGTCNGAGACTNPAIADNTPCADGKSCTTNDKCTAGVCGGTVTCPATDQCHVAGTCDGAGACTNPRIADNTPCVDGNACTQTDLCQAGVCTGTNPMTCTASNQCHTVGTCNTGTGECSDPEKPNGTSCDDGSACTVNDACQAGACTAGSGVTCAAPDQCHQGAACNPAAMPAPPSNGLVGWWRFDGDTTDSSGHGLTLTNQGATLTGGISGKAYDFDGTSCLTRTTTGGPLELPGATKLTVMAWVRTSNNFPCPSTAPRAIAGRGIDYSLATQCQGPIAPPLHGPTVTGQVYPLTGFGWGYPGGWGSANIGEWIMVAITWDGQQESIYVNGQYGLSYPDVSATVGHQTDIFAVGCAFHPIGGVESHFFGSIDEVSVYDRDLSASEIAAYYAAVKNPCTYTAKTDGTACNDGNLCTTGDACQAGACTGAPKTCAAQDGCHAAGTCSAGTGVCSNPVQPGGSCALGIWPGSPTIIEPGPGMVCSAATGINAAGTIIGYSDLCTGPDWPGTQAATGFVRGGGTFQELTAPFGATAFFPVALSDTGYVVGNASGSSQNAAHVYRPASSTQPEQLNLGAFGSKVWAVKTIPYTDLPLALGEGVTIGAGGPWVWTSAAVQPTGNASVPFTSFPPPTGFSGEGAVLGVNQQGDMVGYYTASTGERVAMVSIGGGPVQPLHDLLTDPLAAAPWILETAVAINNDRQIVGVGKLDGIPTAFRVELSYGSIASIETPGPYANAEALIMDAGLLHRPTAINNSGITVGTIGAPADPAGQNIIPTRAFLSFEDKLYDLNSFVSMPEGWVLIAATGINDSNQVSGIALDPATNRSIAFEVTPQGLPSAAQLECAHLAEGAACTHGNFCPTNNVCHNGTCGGPDPADAVCLEVDAVVDNGHGSYIAVLGYDSSAPQTIIPTINQVEVDDLLADVSPQPPEWLLTGPHPYVYKPTFGAANSNLSWRVNGQRVYARAADAIPQQSDPAGPFIMIGSRRIDLPRSIDQFSALPPDPTGNTTLPQPTVGDQYFGALKGTFAVTPTGASTYSLPIKLPPGIAGMVPNLNLTYNSQAGDGVAGQGWQISGASLIQRCPKTQVSDGLVEQVDLTVSPPKGGVCLDGKRILKDTQGNDFLEINDFSEITELSGGGFLVKTKSGERRYYGHDDTSRVTWTSPTGTQQTIIWMLNRVVDQWGNYYDLTYNQGSPATGVPQDGLLLTSISYTGHLDSTAGAGNGFAPFYKVSFNYASRNDPRPVRIGQFTMTQRQLLQSIYVAESAGRSLWRYDLSYSSPTVQQAADTTMLPSMLYSITFTSHIGDLIQLPPLTFGWEGGGFSFQASTAYQLPEPIDVHLNDDHQPSTFGSQFVDIDGDGRLDMVRAQLTPKKFSAWRNTGTGWQDMGSDPPPPQGTSNASWIVPFNLIDGGGRPAGSRFADVNGDGLLDFISSGNGGVCDASGHCTLKICDSSGSCSSNEPSLKVYLNKSRGTYDPATGTWSCLNNQCWQPFVQLCDLPTSLPPNVVLTHHEVNVADPHNMFADMDGDGMVDYINIVDATFVFPGHDAGANPYPNGELQVFLNRSAQGQGWVYEPRFSFANADPGLGDLSGYHLEDINRDGLADLVANDHDGSIKHIAINEYSTLSTTNAWQKSSATYAVSPPWGARRANNVDLTSDGYFDTIMTQSQFQRDSINGGREDVVHDCHGQPSVPWYDTPLIFLGNGLGYEPAPSAGYPASLKAALPPLDSCGGIPDTSFLGWATADLNADGLSDMILYKPVQPRGAGRLLVNTGEAFADVEGQAGFQSTTGPHPVPVMPFTALDGDPWAGLFEVGTTFIDLNGDGVLDVVKAWGDPLFQNEAYINQYRPPHIKTFSNGRAQDTTVTYVATTSAEAVGTYSDPHPIAAGTTAITMPLWVVSSVQSEDGRANGTLATTTYQYESIRGSATRHGPQGFFRTTVTSPGGNGTAATQTETTYAQAYPYTGRPLSVVRKRGSATLDVTKTEYCAHESTSSWGCDQLVGPIAGLPFNPFSRYAVFASRVSSSSFPMGSNPPLGTESIDTETQFQYDGFGNGTSQTVDMSRAFTRHVLGLPIKTSAEHYRTTTTNVYGEPGSDERAQGKLTSKTVVTGRIDMPQPGSTHITSYTYGHFGGSNIYGEQVRALALSKMQVEPGAEPGLDQNGHPANATETDTAYHYDDMGNVVITTVCATDFDSCTAGADNGSGPDARDDDVRLHPRFRTTTVSYDPSLFVAGPNTPITTLPYTQKGRYPVVTTDPEGNKSYTAYDPTWGAITQTTDPNHVSSCSTYDAFGRISTQTSRCGSQAPLKTTTNYFKDPGFVDASFVVAATTAPTGARSWSYIDVLDRQRTSITQGFDGTLIQQGMTIFDALGRMVAETKPQPYPDTGLYATGHSYDSVGNEYQTTQDLGPIQGPGTGGSSLVTHTHVGSTITTDEQVTIVDPATSVSTTQHRQVTETKNVMGKTTKITRAVSGTALSSMTYSYDIDGDLTDTIDDAGNDIHVTYDIRGRKTAVTDPDVGTLTYVYDGFGDLREQYDSNAPQTPTQMTYDRFDRMTGKTDADGTSEWVWDVAPNGLGKLAGMNGPVDGTLAGSCSGGYGQLTTGNRARTWFSYTALGDVAQKSECVDGDVFDTSYGYDDPRPLGRLTTLTYPTVYGNQLVVHYYYSRIGDLMALGNDTDHKLIWAPLAVNAQGQVTDEETRNGVETVYNRNPSTGWLQGTVSTAYAQSKTIQGWTYHYNEAGSLQNRYRSDDISGGTTTESFGYDALDRLTVSRVQVAPGYDETTSYGYDPLNLGNLTSKGGKTYVYDGSCSAGSRSAGPHAVCSVGDDTFAYDANGNMTSGRGRTMIYNARNKVSQIVSAGTAPNTTAGIINFAYGADGSRVLQVAQTQAATGPATARTAYVGMTGTGQSLYERTATTTDGGNVRYEHVRYIVANGGTVAMQVTTSEGGVASSRLKFPLHDHLGSVTAISDETGNVVAAADGGPDATVMSYDPWGTRRNPDGSAPAPASFNLQAGHREFTGQETIPSVGLTNLNGRVYDPELGRFLSPDPTVQFVKDPQDYNRYSYVLNNPLRYADPTGFSVMNGPVGTLVPGALAIASMALCTTAVGCVAAITVNTAWSIASARAQGASWDAAIGPAAFSAAVGLMALGVNEALSQQAASGLTDLEVAHINEAKAVNGFVSSTITNIASANGQFSGNFFFAEVVAAEEAAASFVAAQQTEVSLADVLQANSSGMTPDQVAAAAMATLSSPPGPLGGNTRRSFPGDASSTYAEIIGLPPSTYDRRGHDGETARMIRDNPWLIGAAAVGAFGSLGAVWLLDASIVVSPAVVTGTGAAGGVGMPRLADWLSKVSPLDSRIIQTAQQLAGKAGGFTNDLGALVQSVGQHIPAGQVHRIGEMNGADIWGSLVSRVGIVVINGMTTVVSAPMGQQVQILGPFHP